MRNREKYRQNFSLLPRIFLALSLIRPGLHPTLAACFCAIGNKNAGLSQQNARRA
jgi:hypothetical protein